MARKIDLDKINIRKLRRYNEDILRKHVIIPLLEELGADHIKDMHKNKENEQGIDVYFDALDIFGHQRRFGVQIKRINLVCQSRPDKNKNIETICTQLRLAFGKEITLSTSEAGKITVHIDGYYVITSGIITQMANNYIYQQRKTYPYVHIIDGELLLKIIRQRKEIKRGKEFKEIKGPLSLPLKRIKYSKKR